MTFSRPAIHTLLSKSFVPTWHNQAPDVFPKGDGAPQQQAYPESYYANFPDGAGGANMRIFFCTPDGRIVHNTQGHLTDSSLKREAAFALALLAGDLSKERLRAAHKTRIAELRAEQKKLRAKQPVDPAERKAHGLRLNLVNVRINNHVLAQQRLLEDPKPYMINEDLGFV